MRANIWEFWRYVGDNVMRSGITPERVMEAQRLHLYFYDSQQLCPLSTTVSI